jgi:hypothetical protein
MDKTYQVMTTCPIVKEQLVLHRWQEKMDS